MRPGREAKPVDEALDAAATADEAQVVERRGEDDVLAAALEVAPVVEAAALRRRGQVLDAHPLDAEQRALGERPAVVEGDGVLVVETQTEMGRLVHRRRRRRR